MLDISDGMLDLMAYKFKKYLGSVSREIQNRRLKMGRLIDCKSSVSNRATWYANNCEICSKVNNECPYYGKPYTEHEPLYCSGLDINKLKENIDNGNDD